MRLKNRSIRTRIAIAIIGVVIGVIALICILNTTLLGFFYTRQKIKNMVSAFNMIYAGAESGELYLDDYQIMLEKLSSNENLSILIMSSDGTVVLSSQDRIDYLLSQMYMTLLGSDNDSFWGSLDTEDYSIKMIRDERFGEDYLVLWGTLSDGNIVMMRTAVTSMRESAEVTNLFLLWVGLASIGVAGLVAFFLSRIMERTINILQDENAKLTRDIELKEKAETMRKEFISNVSHELKTPIAVIQGYADMLSRWGKDDEKVLEEGITAIQSESAHMKKLIEQLLFLARGDSGKTELKPERVMLNELMQELYEESLMIDETHVYRLSGTEEALMLRADSALLKQAARILKIGRAHV